MRTWAASVGLSLAAACAAVPVDPYEVPLDALSEKAREEVRDILSDVAAKVELDAADVKSRPEIYDFLLTEMPFTGGVVREMRRDPWEIFRDPEKPTKNVFFVLDPEGIRLRFELVHRDATRRFYVTRGTFDVGLLGTFSGRTVIIVRTVPEGDVVRTDAIVYVRVDTASNLAKGFKELVAQKVRDRAGYFIKAARWVAEETARRPDWLYMQVRGSPQVDAEVLEEFRRRFVR